MERIRFSNVTKTFSLHRKRKLLRGHVSQWFKSSPSDVLYALRDVSFTIFDGDGVAVIGANGAGKSTILNLTTRLCYPDEGEVCVTGRVAPVLELGAGFHPDLTGSENLFLNASLFGLTRKRVAELHDEIVEFSGLGDLVGEPIRMYSSGMVARLAFAVAAHVDADILLIDEVLAVGDEAFQNKCTKRILNLRAAGKTMLCVSHAPEMLRKMCSKGVLLDRGKVVFAGTLDDVLATYQQRAVHATISL